MVKKQISWGLALLVVFSLALMVIQPVLAQIAPLEVNIVDPVDAAETLRQEIPK